MSLTNSWLFWASLSAVFAALTAIFAKIGVEHVNSDFATFVRTIVVIVALVGLSFVNTEKPPVPVEKAMLNEAQPQ